MRSIIVLIVTYNRCQYLMNLLEGLCKQTKKIDSILIVDNFSTDGTPEKLIENKVIQTYEELKVTQNIWNDINVMYYRNNKNAGGAGGFHLGTKLALDLEYDYLWMMDDDVLPESECLEQLLSNITNECGVCIPNRTTETFIDKPITSFNWNGVTRLCSYKTYSQVTDVERAIEVCDMPFEGPLIRYDVLKAVGASDEKYFIFYDDSDYAQRCLQATKILFVPKAVLKKQIVPQIKEGEFSWRDYYVIRNDILFDKKFNPNKCLPYVRATLVMLRNVFSKIRRKNLKACEHIFRAYLDGIRGIGGKTVLPGQF